VQTVGGSVVAGHAYPWMVNVQPYAGAKCICGGSIINNRWILTTGRCLIENKNDA